MESVFHKHEWDRDTQRAVTLTEIRSRPVRAVRVVEPLQLADLTAPGVMAGHFGLNLGQWASRDYTHTQHISAQVHARRGPDRHARFDGLLHPSRNTYPAASAALFEHTAPKIRVTDDIDLVEHVDWPGFVDAYRIGVIIAP